MPWAPLDADTLELLRAGDTDGRYREPGGDVDVAALACSLALRFRNAGRTLAEYRDAMLDPAHAAYGQTVAHVHHRRGLRAAERWLEKRWHRAGDRPRPVSAGGLDPEAAERFLEWATDRHDWSGKAGKTDLVMLHVTVALAVQVGDTFALGERDAAERADVTRKTARRSLRRLRERGVLVLEAADHGPHAAIYRLVVPAHVRRRRKYPTHASGNPPCGMGGLGSGVVASRPADAWAWRALGPTARLIYAALRDGEQTDPADLARATHSHPRTVARNLARLADVGLAVEAEPGGWLRGDGDLDAAADAYGTAGRGATMRALHASQRRAWRDRLDGWGWAPTIAVAEDGATVVDVRSGEVVGRLTAEAPPPPEVLVDPWTGDTLRVAAVEEAA